MNPVKLSELLSKSGKGLNKHENKDKRKTCAFKQREVTPVQPSII